jgi:hypothetical protein
MFAEDLEDAFHLSIFSGCTGRPFWSRVFTIDEHGQVVPRWRLVMGCDVYSCLGLCDKAMSGFCIDGFVGRFAAAHFGQRNAGSPLNALMRAIQRFLARRAPPPPSPLRTARTLEPEADAPAVPLSSATPRGLHPTALHSAGLGGRCCLQHKDSAAPPLPWLGRLLPGLLSFWPPGQTLPALLASLGGRARPWPQ